MFDTTSPSPQSDLSKLGDMSCFDQATFNFNINSGEDLKRFVGKAR